MTKTELTEEEIFEKNEKLIDIYYDVVSKNWTHMEYEDIVSDPSGEHIISGHYDYIINDRFVLGRSSDADIKARLKLHELKRRDDFIEREIKDGDDGIIVVFD
jgi:hypothetical protein